MAGRSFSQVGHQVAQKLRSPPFPLKSKSLTLFPSRFLRAKSAAATSPFTRLRGEVVSASPAETRIAKRSRVTNKQQMSPRFVTVAFASPTLGVRLESTGPRAAGSGKVETPTLLRKPGHSPRYHPADQVLCDPELPSQGLVGRRIAFFDADERRLIPVERGPHLWCQKERVRDVTVFVLFLSPQVYHLPVAGSFPDQLVHLYRAHVL